jgi:signal transduction histidine kinase
MKEIKNIEKFFLVTLLQISIAGVSLILITDLLFYPKDILSLYIDVVILAACALAYLLRDKYSTTSSLIIIITTLVAMFYQSMAVPINTTTSFAVVLIVGFIISILLKDRLQWTFHGITVLGIIVIFFIQATSSSLRPVAESNETITMGITYCVLYFLIAYCTSILKGSYNRVNSSLRTANTNLIEKAKEIAAQNEELLQIQNNLNELNTNLERTVDERTQKVKIQNEILLKYSYANAHHLRGPIARLLGLVTICRMDTNPDYTFFLDNIERQCKEIDKVVKQINSELSAVEPH